MQKPQQGITVKTTLDGKLVLTSVKLLPEELENSIKPLLTGAPKDANLYARVYRTENELYSELEMSVSILNNEVHKIMNLAEMLNMIHSASIRARLRIQTYFTVLSKLMEHEETESNQAEQN